MCQVWYQNLKRGRSTKRRRNDEDFSEEFQQEELDDDQALMREFPVWSEERVSEADQDSHDESESEIDEKVWRLSKPGTGK
jgi:hypothetical protein